MRLLAGLAALALGAPPAAAAPPPPIPVEALAEIPFIAEPILSPDGKRILAKINSRGKEVLAVYDLPTTADSKPRIVPYQGGLRWYAWAGSDRVLVGEQRFGLLLNFLPLPISRVSRFDLKIGQSMDVGKPEGMLGDQLVFADPEGRFVLLAAQKDMDDTPSVSRVDLATGDAVEVQKKKAGIWSWFADSGGTIRGGIAYDEKGWTIYSRDPATGELRKGATAKLTGRESVIDSVHLLPGADRGVIVTNERTGRFGVYDYSLTALSVGEPIFEHPEVDVTKPVFTADGTAVEGVYYDDDKPRVAWLTPEMKKLQADLDRTFPGKVNRVVTISRDRNTVLLHSAAADDPGTFYVFDRKARRMEVFAAPHTELSGKAMSDMKPIRYRARDGLEIPGYLTLPLGREAKGLPLVVMPHGGPFVRDRYGFDPFVQFLASRGYAVLQPNFRGSTGYGRDYVERGYGQWGTGMQDDLDDGVAWLVGQGLIDPKRVCIYGISYGGYAALWGAIRNPDIYRCAASFAGVTDIRAMLKYDARMLSASRYSRQWRSKVQGEEKRDLAAVSPLQQAARLKLPVLIAHGDRDANVPADQGRKLVAALRQQGAPVLAAFYPQAGHGFGSSADAIDFMKRLEAFLEVHNPADSEPRAPREAQLAAGSVSPAELALLAGKKAPRGKVGLRYLVAPDGRVGSCGVSAPSGAPGVDKQVCTLVVERFQYRPAVGANGAFQESWQSWSGSWEPPAAK
jgi:dipeptidyl aminopeptidase/acylaminoacyl peptidase